MKSVYIKFYEYIPNSLKIKVKLLIPLLGIAGFLEVASLAALIPLISFILDNQNSNHWILKLFCMTDATEMKKIIVFFSIFLCLIILKGIYVFFVTRFYLNTVLQIKGSVQKRLFQGYLNKDFIKHLNSNTSNYIRNIITEANMIEGRFVMPSIILFAELFPVFFVMGFLFYLNPQGITFTVIVFLMAGFTIAKFTSKSLKSYGKEQMYNDGMQIKVAQEAFTSLKEIKLYKTQNQVSKLYGHYVDTTLNLWGKALSLQQIPKFILEIIGLVAISIIAGVSFAKGSTANEVMIEVTIFMAAIVKMMPSVSKIISNIQLMSHGKNSILNVLSEYEEFEVDNKAHNSTEQKIDNFSKLTLSDIAYKYNNREDFVFKNINIEIIKNTIIGLEGESGSGKSTLINILLGFIIPTSGKFLVNEIDIENSLSAWQKKISYLPQDVVLFDDSLRNNITFYNANIEDKKIMTILKSLNLDKLVSSLPNGLDTQVGESGSFLSGGQKQRIGIARALAREPEFLILDEATSALDEESEIAVNQAIKELKQKCTVLIIAHKKSAFEICDKVYKLDNGKLYDNTHQYD
jgi:ATP-binding cassette subfamily C protein